MSTACDVVLPLVHCHSNLCLPPQAPPTPTDSGVERLEFSLSDNIKSAIEKGREEMERWARTLDLDFLEYETYGRDLIKAKGLSPDAVLQLAIQVGGGFCDLHQARYPLLLHLFAPPPLLLSPHPQIAYYRQYKCSVPTYESCSTAAFRHGRTETIRSATLATKVSAEVFEMDHPAGVEEMMQKMRESSARHSALTKEAAMGEYSYCRRLVPWLPLSS